MQRRTRSFLAVVLIGAALAGLACESAPLLICTEGWAEAGSAAPEAASEAATAARDGMRGRVRTDSSPHAKRTAL